MSKQYQFMKKHICKWCMQNVWENGQIFFCQNCTRIYVTLRQTQFHRIKAVLFLIKGCKIHESLNSYISSTKDIFV